MLSIKQRKALGRRYGVDPALLMEMDRLNRQYALAPGREARGIQAAQFASAQAQQASQFEVSKEQQASQFGESLAQQTAAREQAASQFGQSQAQQASQFGTSMAYNTEQARLNRAYQEERDRQAEKGGMITAGTGLLTNVALMRAMSKAPGTPFFGETVSGLGSKAGAGIKNLFTTTPALTDAGATGAGVGTPGFGVSAGMEGMSGAAPVAGAGMEGMAGAGAAEAGVGTAGSTVGSGMSTGAAGAYVAGISAAEAVTAPVIEEQVGTTAKHVTSIAAEAGKGAIIGTKIMPGIGTVIGGALGAIGGAVRESTGTNWLDPVEVVITKVFGGSK